MNDVNMEQFNRLAKDLAGIGMKEFPARLVMEILKENLPANNKTWDANVRGLETKVEVNTKKVEERHYLDSYQIEVQTAERAVKYYDRMQYGNTLSLTQAVNAADGRPFGRTWRTSQFNKDKAPEEYFSYAYFNFEKMNKFGNPELVKVRGRDIDEILGEYGTIKQLQDKESYERYKQGFLRGNKMDVDVFLDGDYLKLKSHLALDGKGLRFFDKEGNEFLLSLKGPAPQQTKEGGAAVAEDEKKKDSMSKDQTVGGEAASKDLKKGKVAGGDDPETVDARPVKRGRGKHL